MLSKLQALMKDQSFAGPSLYSSLSSTVELQLQFNHHTQLKCTRVNTTAGRIPVTVLPQCFDDLTIHDHVTVVHVNF